MAKGDFDHIADLHRKIEELRMQMHDLLGDREEATEVRDPMQDAMAMAAVMRGLEHALGPLTAAIERDAAKDQEVGQNLVDVHASMERLTACVDKLTGCVDELTDTLKSHSAAMQEHSEVLRTPKTRTGRLMLPEGPVEMTITEAREPHKGH